MGTIVIKEICAGTNSILVKWHGELLTGRLVIGIQPDYLERIEGYIREQHSQNGQKKQKCT